MSPHFAGQDDNSHFSIVTCSSESPLKFRHSHRGEGVAPLWPIDGDLKNVKELHQLVLLGNALKCDNEAS